MAPVPKCLGSEVSWVRSVLTPYCRLLSVANILGIFVCGVTVCGRGKFQASFGKKNKRLVDSESGDSDNDELACVGQMTVMEIDFQQTGSMTQETDSREL